MWALGFLVSLALATALGVVLLVRTPRPRAIEGFLRLVTPPATIVALGVLLVRVLAMPTRLWSDPRLAPSFALRLGYPVYPLRETPLFGHIYGPVPPLIYLPATFAGTPNGALMGAGLIAILCALAPVLWLIARETGTHRRAVVILALFAAFVLFCHESSPLTYGLFSIHVDAIALGLAALACGMLPSGRDLSLRRFVPAASALVLAVWSKQTMAMLLLVLPVSVLVTSGKAAFSRFSVVLLAVGAAISAVMLACFGLENLWLNMVVVPSHHSVNYGKLPAYFLDLLVEGRVPLVVCLSALLLRRSAPEPIPPVAGRWLLFSVVALLMVPPSLIARAKFGGDLNSFAGTLYFLAISAVLWLAPMLVSEAQPALLRSSIGVLLAAALAVTVAWKGGLCYEKLKAQEHAAASSSQIAYDFSRESPGAIYFPWNPSAVMMAEKRAYHFDYGLVDRRAAGMPLTPAQFAAYFPQSATTVAFPADATEEVRSFIAQSASTVFNPRFPSWRLYPLR